MKLMVGDLALNQSEFLQTRQQIWYNTPVMKTINIKFFTKQRVALAIVCLFLFLCPLSGQQNKFPDWMDEVEFKSNAKTSQEFQFNGPIDPETGRESTLGGSSKGIFKKPKLPDFSKLREKALKAKLAQREADAPMFKDTISFSEKNQPKLQESSDQLRDLLKTITDPIEKKKVANEKDQLDNKLGAMAKLYQLIGNNPANLKNSLANLTDADYKQALDLKKMIFGKPSDFKETSPAKHDSGEKKIKPLKSSKKERFYRPKKLKSFYQESRDKKLSENQEMP